MIDYKNMCNWRQFVATRRQRERLQVLLFLIVLFLIYGFAGTVEHAEPDAYLELFVNIPNDLKQVQP